MNIVKRVILRFRQWWTGYIHVDSTLHDPTAKDAHFNMTVYPPSRINLVLKHVVDFWLVYWQWIIGTLIALGVLIVMILDHLKKK